MDWWPTRKSEVVHLLRSFRNPLDRIPGRPVTKSAVEAPRVPEAPFVADARAGSRGGFLLARRRLADIFTPARPLSGMGLHPPEGGADPFVGRQEERERISRALVEDRVHVLIHGDRGTGKTSLANVAVAMAEAANFDVVRYVCSAGSDFDAIMRGLIRGLPRPPGAPFAAGADAGGDRADFLPPRPLRPEDVLAELEAFRRSRLVFVIDEFDRVACEATRTAIADLIKHFSDRRTRLSLVIVGVSDSAEKLLGHHPSIQRCLSRIALPLLTDGNVEQIAGRGEEAGLYVPAAARTCIAELARGVPYMAQLLSLRAGQAALDNHRTDIRGSDLMAAIMAATVEADPRLHLLYDTVTGRERDPAVLGVLRAAAAGARDAFGRFRVGREGSVVKVAGVQADPAAWRRVLEAGAIHAADGGGPDLYAFGEAMLPHLVLHRAVLARRAAAGVAKNPSRQGQRL